MHIPKTPVRGMKEQTEHLGFLNLIVARVKTDPFFLRMFDPVETFKMRFQGRGKCPSQVMPGKTQKPCEETRNLNDFFFL
jgi:hypothetical protein